jgi:hypothetical protein
MRQGLWRMDLPIGRVHRFAFSEAIALPRLLSVGPQDICKSKLTDDSQRCVELFRRGFGSWELCEERIHRLLKT